MPASKDAQVTRRRATLALLIVAVLCLVAGAAHLGALAFVAAVVVSRPTRKRRRG
jgi:hypothetical protein